MGGQLLKVLNIQFFLAITFHVLNIKKRSINNLTSVFSGTSFYSTYWIKVKPLHE